MRRKCLLLKASQARFINAYHPELNNFEHEIIMFGEMVASKIDGHHSEEEINLEIRKYEQKINSISQNALDNIQSALQNELTRLKTQLEELQQSFLGRSLAEEFQIYSVDGKGINNKETPVSSRTLHFINIGSEFLKNLGGFASQISRDIVYNVGKYIGIKFKPFGAFKAAECIRNLGPVIAGLGVAIDIFTTAKQEQNEAEYQQKLRQARAEIRQSFRNVACDMKNEYEINIEKAISFYDEELWDIELKRNELSKNEESKVEIIIKIHKKLQEIKHEISLLTK